MTKNLCDLRFGVNYKNEYSSSIWRLWISARGDVYLTTKNMGGITKYSFHISGICRSAFTLEKGAPSPFSDRAMFKWRRSATPSIGSGKASRVAWISFPTDFLSRISESNEKLTTWVPAAPPKKSTYIELCFSMGNKEEVLSAFQNNSHFLLNYIPLPNGEAFFISYYYDDWDDKDVLVPVTKNSIFQDLIFSTSDPYDTGRPIRIQFGPAPKDGDALMLIEIGGYQDKDIEHLL
ncbi:MAG TPA: hypothetical protein PKL78_09025 [Anaerolineales bacterium]|nr:hypothetical protein [Cyclobacteriaceae bacterium]HNN13687.1 hypothetical protein [Anaerolineales bacterium]